MQMVKVGRCVKAVKEMKGRQSSSWGSSKRLIEENLVKHNEAIEQIEKDIAKIEDKIKREGRENDDSKDVVGKGV